ncbi:MAG: prepilin peptidase [Dehalococcoidales bacterium]|nr:prepilin peptidase [Dehalococcoidales bacterium]
MTILLTAVFTLLGIAVGSFLNVCIDRLPLRKSLVYPPSHCDSCQQRLSVKDLIPLFSYLWLRGCCRYCRARIPLRVPLVEVLSGALFFLAFWRFGLSVQFALTAFWCCVFLMIIFIDWEHQLILNKVTYPAAIVALVILAIDTLLPEPGILGNLGFLPQPSILSGIIGGAIGFVFFLIVFLINPRGMGMGDVKLAGLIGLVTGLPLIIVGLLTGILLGGLVAVVLLLLRRKGRKDVIPYGTFLAIGPILALLWGNEIFDWYLGFF